MMITIIHICYKCSAVLAVLLFRNMLCVGEKLTMSGKQGKRKCNWLFTFLHFKEFNPVFCCCCDVKYQFSFRRGFRQNTLGQAGKSQYFFSMSAAQTRLQNQHLLFIDSHLLYDLITRMNNHELLNQSHCINEMCGNLAMK